MQLSLAARKPPASRAARMMGRGVALGMAGCQSGDNRVWRVLNGQTRTLTHTEPGINADINDALLLALSIPYLPYPSSMEAVTPNPFPWSKTPKLCHVASESRNMNNYEAETSLAEMA